MPRCCGMYLSATYATTDHGVFRRIDSTVFKQRDYVAMTAQPQIARRDGIDTFFEALAGILKWLAQVAAIAIGTCLGIILFLMVAREYAGDKLDQLDLRDLSPSSTSSPSGVGNTFG